MNAVPVHEYDLLTHVYTSLCPLCFEPIGAGGPAVVVGRTTVVQTDIWHTRPDLREADGQCRVAELSRRVLRVAVRRRQSVVGLFRDSSEVCRGYPDHA